MTRAIRWFTELVAHLLDGRERDAVRGDLDECGVSGWRAVFEILDLVVRRHVALWADWRPWLALVGVVLPLGVLLSHASRAWADSTAIGLSLYLRLWEWSYLAYPGWRWELFGVIGSGVLSASALSVWSWTCGYTLASVSRRTVWSAVAVFVLLVFFATFGTSTVARLQHDKFAGHFYGVVLPRLFRTAFVMVPLVWGVYSRQKGTLRPSTMLAGASLVLALTVVKSPGLENALVWGRGSYGQAGPDRTHGTSDDPRPLWPIAFVMLGPTAYMLATAMPRRRSRLDA